MAPKLKGSKGGAVAPPIRCQVALCELDATHTVTFVAFDNSKHVGNYCRPHAAVSYRGSERMGFLHAVVNVLPKGAK